MNPSPMNLASNVVPATKKDSFGVTWVDPQVSSELIQFKFIVALPVHFEHDNLVHGEHAALILINIAGADLQQNRIQSMHEF